MPKDVESISVASLPSMPISERNKLPYIAAVYFAIDENQEIHYVGQTTNLRGRIASHHKLADFRSMNLAIAWMQVSEVETLRVTEKQLIEYHKPKLNNQLQEKYPGSQIKISLGHRREIVDWIAEHDGRSVSQTICLLLDIFLDKYDEINEAGKQEKRKFIDMSQRLGENATAGFLLKQFLKQEFSEDGFLNLLKVTNINPCADLVESFSLNNVEAGEQNDAT